MQEVTLDGHLDRPVVIDLFGGPTTRSE